MERKEKNSFFVGLLSTSETRNNLLKWLSIKEHSNILWIGELACVMREYLKSELWCSVEEYKDFPKIFSDISYDYIFLYNIEINENFFKSPNKFLNQDGKLIWMVDNCFGIHRMSGAMDINDIVQYQFLQDNACSEFNRSISIKRLRYLLNKYACNDFNIYYPYPNAIFTKEVYSDYWLPSRTAAEELFYIPDNGMKVYDEKKVMQNVIAEKMFPEFANSYVVVMQNSKEINERIIYSKFSNERNPKYNIRTDIIKNTNGLYVRKVNDNKLAEQHINSIELIYNKLLNKFKHSDMKVVRAYKAGAGVCFDYIKGKTLDSVFDEYLKKGEYVKAKILLQQYVNRILEAYDCTESDNNSQKLKCNSDGRFLDVFGNIVFEREQIFKLDLDIDLIPQNIIIDDNGNWNVIDYEWTFIDFSIPVKFVIYRAISYYFYQSKICRDLFRLDNLLRDNDINDNEIYNFRIMEKQMQEYITKGNYSICREIDKICSEHYEFCNENQNKNSASKIQIYYDYGNGFSETNSNIINATLLNDKYYFDATIPYGLQNVRIDIGNQGCILDDISIQIIDTDGKRSRVDIKTVAHNGEYINNKIYILNDDPQLVLENLTKKSKEIVMEYKYTTIELEIIDIYNSEKNKLSKVEKDYSELLRVSDERFLTLSNKIDNYRLEIDNIHSSSSWKITKPLRAIKKIIYKQ